MWAQVDEVSVPLYCIVHLTQEETYAIHSLLHSFSPHVGKGLGGGVQAAPSKHAA